MALDLSIAFSQYWHKKCLNKNPTCITAFLSANPKFLPPFPRNLFSRIDIMFSCDPDQLWNLGTK